MIRKASMSDVEGLSVLMNELGYPTTISQMKNRFKVIFNHQDYHTYVYEKDSQIVGMVGFIQSFRYENDDAYIRIVAMVTHTNYRGMGIGEKMLHKVEDWARHKNIDTITLNSGNRVERKVAHKFYEKHGFVGSAIGFYKKLR
ncbi:GNAT family N-acetyltransferase [Bacillaceae bacterium W0354]